MSDMFLIQLPLDVLTNIFTNLSFADLRNVMLTCKALKDIIASDNCIWRSISRDKLIIHNSTDNSQTITYSWYNKCRISHNWTKGIYHSKVVLYHQCNYMPWLKFHNSQVLLLSVGSELHCFQTDRKGFPYCKETLWKLQVPIVKRYDVRTNDISRFVVKNNLIICGNRDGCASLYQMRNLKRRPQLVSHIRDCHENGHVEVTAVELINSQYAPCVVTASASIAKLRYWCLTSDDNTNGVPNLINMRCIDEVYLGENVGIRCLATNNTENKLAIGLSGNSKPLLLEATTNQILMTFDETKSIRQAVRDIQWHSENMIVYVTHSGVLQMLDIRTGAVIYEVLDPFQSSLYCVKSDGKNALLVGSSEYSRCVLFDTRNSGSHAQMYFTQKKSSPIYSLDFDSTKLIAAADRSIAVLNYNINVTSVIQRDYSHTFELVNR